MSGSARAASLLFCSEWQRLHETVVAKILRNSTDHYLFWWLARMGRVSS